MPSLDLNTFNQNSEFYPEFDFVLTVKSFDQLAIRKRYLEARKRGGKQMGSVERRAVSDGGVVRVTPASGKLDYETLAVLKEPRGIAASGDLLAISSENKVYILENGKTHEINNPWFSYIHTVDFHPTNSDRVLISSSGLDCIFEYDWRTGELLQEWFAWENGYNEGLDKSTGEQVLITRSSAKAKEWERLGKKHLLISNPEEQVLPTAQRAAFINSVLYDIHNPDQWLATLFHKGIVIKIDPKSGESESLIDGLKNPHGGRSTESGYMATSTGNGKISLVGSAQTILEFENLGGKPEGMEGLEWLQNSIQVDGLIWAIDSNRNSLIVIDLDNKQIDFLAYPLNWAAQDIAIHKITDENKSLLKDLSVKPTD